MFPAQAGNSVSERSERRTSMFPAQAGNSVSERSERRDALWPPCGHYADEPMTQKIPTKGLLIGIIVLISFGPWIYRWSGFADRPFPDTLDDNTFALVAEPVCAGVIGELPNALDARSLEDRATQVRVGTAQLRVMVDSLGDLTSGTERDQELIGKWLVDWDIYLSDRLGYADRIEVDENAVFYLTQIEGPERLEKRITRFALTNRMISCSTPGDIG